MRLFNTKSEFSSAVIPDTQSSSESNEIVKQLESFRTLYKDRLKLSYYVDEDQTWITSKTLENALAAIASPEDNTTDQETPSTQIIVSGPPGFITYLAGPKLWQDGEEKQGPLGGRLAQVLGKDGRKDVKVWKV